ncbi:MULTISPECIES: type II toxin-antitoxin system antitoxin DNA ADP-ribosyl glycohydrolase DarG [Bacillus cereus group]|uniref:type II toxin-antitoxin system antitoxin DNA ADP-ribosyl glycohydrolase DarG n=1 Tax=Bacillus cereus group TaxID=86661 RepID=UPI000BF626F0|nr:MULTISPECIES: macro domain-containing protein [Bacillus cereus group]PEZ55075.1 hypothetical protein CN363_03910 [Bacillus cereus]PFL82874.1 hypothetical protein COJ32_01320 [Bacillus cereus]PGV08795.1 hypothetical protein COD81_12050 [Bacillus cereus]
MIIYEKGDLFKYLNQVEAIINTVNCVGVMGKGIALEFKKRYPENFHIYKNKCFSKELTIGKSFIYEIPYNEKTKFIINFPTKLHWRNPSKIEYIEKGLDNLIKLIAEYDIKSIAMPALGCGNGNLDWGIVKPLIEKKLGVLNDIKIFIFEPSVSKGMKKTEVQKKTKPRLTADRKKLLLIMNDYNSATTGSLLTYIETHILCYFLNFKNPKINFELKSNGPFSTDVNKIILLLSQYYIAPIESTDSGSAKQIKILTTDFPQRNEIAKNEDYIKVKSLIEGFESYDSLLTLAISHWFRLNNDLKSNELSKQVHSWLEKNGRIPNEVLIIKSINRLEKIYYQPKNLSFDLN